MITGLSSINISTFCAGSTAFLYFQEHHSQNDPSDEYNEEDDIIPFHSRYPVKGAVSSAAAVSFSGASVIAVLSCTSAAADAGAPLRPGPAARR